MALINCPNCNNEISDKAEFCPNCDCTFQHEKKPIKNIICKECKQAYSDKLLACPKCGCPKPQGKKKIKIIVLILTFAIISAIFVLNSRIKSYEYYENAKNVTGYYG